MVGQTAPGNLARQIVPVGRIFCPHLFLFQLVWPNQSIEALEGRHLASGKQGRPLGHLEIRVAQVASPAAFWTFEGWDGVRLRHFNIWGPESNPLKTF